MKQSLVLPVILAISLAVVTSLVALNTSADLETAPSAASGQPTGLAALAELLRQDGVPVVIEPRSRPRLKRDDLAIAAIVVQPTQEPFEESVSEKTSETLEKHLEGGGTVLELRIPLQPFNNRNPIRETKFEFGDDHGKAYVLTSQYCPGSSLDVSSGETPVVLETEESAEFLRLLVVNKGNLVTIQNGIGALNNFLDQADNAKFYVDLVRRMRRAQGRVVFVEAAAGTAADPSLFQALGGWAVGIQWQTLLVAVVGLSAVWRRFGLPVSSPGRSEGTRGLLTTMAEIFREAKKHEFTIDTLRKEFLMRCKSSQGLRSTASEEEALKQVSDEIRQDYELSGDTSRTFETRLAALDRLIRH
ncbi:MAG: hypothetical protein JNM34_01115 [Chthonomonadaceae bacterium]|nr:hypothetical protein [Chthonomonadaceae bacterium]